MMKAAMMGAVAFQKGLGACHSLAHPLSSEKGLHHGLANALCLPAVVDFNETGRRHARLERVRAHSRPGGRHLRRGAFARCASASACPQGLRAEGVSEADIPKLADKAIEDACHRCNPTPGHARRSAPRSLPRPRSSDAPRRSCRRTQRQKGRARRRGSSSWWRRRSSAATATPSVSAWAPIEIVA